MNGKQKKGLVVFAAILVVAIAAIGAYAYFSNSGTNTKASAVAVGSVSTSWVVDFGNAADGTAIGTTYTGDPLVCPGASCVLQPTADNDPNQVTAHVAFSINNTEESDQFLNHWTASIDPTSLPGGCTVADFSVGDEAVGVSHTSAALGVTLKPASDDPLNGYDASVTVQMIDDGTPQDACQGVTPDLIVSATSV